MKSLVALQLSWICLSVKMGMAYTTYYDDLKKENSLYELGPKLLSRPRKIKLYKHYFKALVLSWRGKRRCKTNIKLKQISCN